MEWCCRILFDKKNVKIEENFPVSKGQDVSWEQKKMNIFQKWAVSSRWLKENQMWLKRIDQATKLIVKAVISALKGVQRPVVLLTILSPDGFKQIVCAIKG